MPTTPRALTHAKESLLRWWYRRRGVPRTVNGFTFRVDPRTRWQFSGSYDQGAAEKLRTLVKPGDVIWNVGANVGVYVLQLCRLVGPHGRIRAFEPSPVAADLLSRNVHLNDFADRVHIVRAAVGDTPGEIDYFTVDAAPMGRPGQANPLLPDATAIRVPMVTLDHVCQEEQPSGIVMDIEGWEIAALLSASAMMAAAHAPWMVVELHPDAWQWTGHQAAQLKALLSDRHFDIVPLSGQADPFVTTGQVLLTRTIPGPV